jgi:guanylate kinase
MGETDKKISLENILLISDKDTSEIESFLEGFDYQKISSCDCSIFVEDALKTIVYVGEDDVDSDEKLEFILQAYENKNFIIISKLINGSVKRPKKSYENKNLTFLDKKAVLKSDGKILVDEIKKIFDSYLVPDLKKTRFHIRPYENKCYVLLGPSAVGKTTIRKSILINNLKNVVDSTTRNKRLSETSEDKSFLTAEDFNNLEKEGKIFAVWERNGNKFGFSYDFIEDFKEGYDLIYDCIGWKIIANLKSELIKRNYDINFIPIFLDAENEELERRYIKRSNEEKEILDLTKTQERFDSLKKEKNFVAEELTELLKNSENSPFFIKNEADNPQRTIDIIKNIVIYNRIKRKGESFVDTIFKDILDIDFDGLEFARTISFDEMNKEYVLDFYVQKQMISGSQKDRFLNILNDLSKIYVHDVKREKSYAAILIEKSDLKEEELKFLKTLDISEREIMLKLLEGKTKYFPTSVFNKCQKKDSSFFGGFYEENGESLFDDLIGWSIGDDVSGRNCKMIKTVGVTFYDRKIQSYKKKSSYTTKLLR